MNITKFLIPILAAVLLIGCAAPKTAVLPANPSTPTTEAPNAPQSGEVLWPTTGWQTSTPEEEGIDPDLLKNMQADIHKQSLALHSLLIIRHGRIAFEMYSPPYEQDTRHIMYSVTKSFVSTLAGIAFDQGKLKDLNQPVLDLLPRREFDNLDDRKRAMTVEHLLMMASGLDWVEGDPAYRQMYTSNDWVKAVMDLPMQTEPGQTFVYCSGCSHVLAAIIQQAVGQNLLDFAQQYLFEPLGITNLHWETDAQGLPIGGWGLNITPRDMAKLGYLYLNDGVWEGKQVLSSDWVHTATARHINGGFGYGYQWWNYAPPNTYMAMGRAGQIIFVAPDMDLIVVTTADIAEGHEPIYALLDNYILPAVKE
jgi:CubicO group peptidase (beta-lactamase class C family)